MPKYLLQAEYSYEGTKGVLKEGGSGRREAVRRVTESLGGKLEAFYYAFGKSDVYVIVDVPDNVSMAALSMVVNSTGAVRLNTTPLMSVEEIDAATKKTVNYRPPGQ